MVEDKIRKDRKSNMTCRSSRNVIFVSARDCKEYGLPGTLSMYISWPEGGREITFSIMDGDSLENSMTYTCRDKDSAEMLFSEFCDYIVSYDMADVKARDIYNGKLFPKAERREL